MHLHELGLESREQLRKILAHVAAGTQKQWHHVDAVARQRDRWCHQPLAARDRILRDAGQRPFIMFRASSIRDLALILLVCLFVFWWRLGSLGLIDPDEPFYAQTAREMVATGDWITPQIFGQPQFEKPILFYWLTALSFETFGENEFAARVSSALPATLIGREDGPPGAPIGLLLVAGLTAVAAMGALWGVQHLAQRRP